MTIFGDQLYQYGGAPVNGLFTTGKVFFVKPDTGSDGNTGKTPAKALATVAKAVTLMTADSNDVCYLVSESNTAANTTDYQSATLTWSKDLTHLIGIGAPVRVSQRSRIAQLSTATGVSPLVNITADGCIFSNFQIFHGVADATSIVAAQVTGTRNYFENVHFAGMGDTSKTQSVTGAASLKLDGASECVFKSCVMGLDTATRDADIEGEIWFDGGASRILFDGCIIQSYIDAAGAASVKVNDTTGIDRWIIFKDTFFHTKSTNKTVDQTEVFNIPAGISQGAIALMNCAVLNDGGAPVWTAGTEGIIWANMGAPTAAAAGGFMTNL